MDEKQFSELMQTLNIIVHLQVADLIKGKSLKECIKILYQANIGPAKIGRLLGKTTNHITKEIAVMRKKGELI